MRARKTFWFALGAATAVAVWCWDGGAMFDEPVWFVRGAVSEALPGQRLDNWIDWITFTTFPPEPCMCDD